MLYSAVKLTNRKSGIDYRVNVSPESGIYLVLLRLNIIIYTMYKQYVLYQTINEEKFVAEVGRRFNADFRNKKKTHHNVGNLSKVRLLFLQNGYYRAVTVTDGY